MSSHTRARFCTAVNCMDGRVQLPVIEYLKKRFDADYVDMITEPGPNRLLADCQDSEIVASILTRIDISVHKHGSEAAAIVGHHDCAANPADQGQQESQTRASVEFLRAKHPQVQAIGLWVDSNWQVHELRE